MIRQAVAEGFGLPAPYYPIVVGPGNFSRRAQVVGVDVIEFGGCSRYVAVYVARRCGSDVRNRQVAEPDNFLD